jgi:hypothetical protein
MSDISTQFPSSPAFSSVDFKINTPTLRTETFSGQVRRVGQGHSFYTITGKYANMTASDFGPIQGFVALCQGSLFSFEIVLPKISYTKLTSQTSSTITTSAALSVGAKSVALSGGTSGQYILKAGDFFKFNNHTKVYQCVETVQVGGTLKFSGGLVKAVPSGTQLTITAVPFTMILDGDVQQYSVGNGGMSTMTLEMKEVWTT